MISALGRDDLPDVQLHHFSSVAVLPKPLLQLSEFIAPGKVSQFPTLTVLCLPLALIQEGSLHFDLGLQYCLLCLNPQLMQ